VCERVFQLYFLGSGGLCFCPLLTKVPCRGFIFLQASAAAAQNASGAAGNSSESAGAAAAGAAKKCSGEMSITQYVHDPESGQGGFGNMTFTMSVHLESPFVYYNPEPQNEDDLLMGLTIDIARLLEAELNCKFNFIIGDLSDPGTPNGALAAIGQIPGGPRARAQVAGGALHISVNNSRAVHFSLPYFDTGYILVIQTPEQEANWWGFTLPFHFTLWVAVGVEILIVAIACWLMEAPSCSIFEETDVVQGLFLGFFDSLYWSVTLLLQTPDKAPRTWGGKMVLVAHGWFMLIVIASYTANLASFLTAAEAVPILNSWSDVVESKGAFRLALPKGMSHEDFIRVEQENNPEAIFNIEWTDTWEEAFEKVRNGTVHATFHDEPVAQDFILKRKWQVPMLA
jgi:ABC-type amino acid transport substrate-binding protein